MSHTKSNSCSCKPIYFLQSVNHWWMLSQTLCFLHFSWKTGCDWAYHLNMLHICPPVHHSNHFQSYFTLYHADVVDGRINVGLFKCAAQKHPDNPIFCFYFISVRLQIHWEEDFTIMILAVLSLSRYKHVRTFMYLVKTIQYLRMSIVGQFHGFLWKEKWFEIWCLGVTELTSS